MAARTPPPAPRAPKAPRPPPAPKLTREERAKLRRLAWENRPDTYCDLCGSVLPRQKRPGNPIRFCPPGWGGSQGFAECKQVFSKFHVFALKLDAIQFPPTEKGEAAAMIMRNSVKDVEEGLQQRGVRLRKRRAALKTQAQLF